MPFGSRSRATPPIRAAAALRLAARCPSPAARRRRSGRDSRCPRQWSQPAPFQTRCSPSASTSIMLAAPRLSGRRLRPCTACRSRRTSRCASTASTVLATRYAATLEIEQSRERRRRVVGVQRRQHEVAGQRRLRRDLRRLRVANFADEHDVRILAQQRAQRVANVTPTFSFTGTCGTPDSSYSTGSSTVRIFSRPVRIISRSRRTASSSCPSRSDR